MAYALAMRKFLLRAAPAVLFAALLLRWPGLDAMPFHTDEANNALLLDETLSVGKFNYRPHEHHGPTLFYLAAPWCRALGVGRLADMEAWQLRAVTVGCGALAAASVLLLAPWLGRLAAVIGALTVAGAAPLHYYNRVFIHESLLLPLTVWLLAALWRWRDTRRWRWAVAGGVLAGLMVATKENAAVTVALVAWPFLLPADGQRAGRVWPSLLVMALAALTVVLALIGPRNLWLALLQHTARGLDSGHNHPWWQYFVWFGSWRGPGLPWSAWLGALAAGVAAVNWRRLPAARVLAPTLGGLLLFHCLLPYKTPWLMAVPLLLLLLLAAPGWAMVCRRLPRPALALPVAAVLALTLAETWSRSFHHQVAADNPLAYAPTSPAAAGITRDLPADRDAVIQVVAEDYWPLPWLLRKYPRVGYWTAAPQRWPGEVLICSPAALGWVPEIGDWRFTARELRPGVTVLIGVRHE
jgi:predicted membrane-bound mannosyltransferase